MYKPSWPWNGLILSKIALTLAIALVPFFFPVEAPACTLIYPTVETGPNFRVRVTDRGRPVEGLPLKLVDSDFFGFEHHAALHSITDEDGFATFTKVSPGSYFLSAKLDGGITDGATVEVKSGGPLNVTVPLKWPNTPPLRVRTARGSLSISDQPPTGFRLSLSLLEGLSGRIVDITQTDSRGQFAFGDVPSGIYFLQLDPSGLKDWSGDQITGLIAIEVSRDAAEDQLDLDLGWSSCGLSYKDRSQCPQTKLELTKVCGDFVDVVGAVIGNASVQFVGRRRGWEGSGRDSHKRYRALRLAWSERGHAPDGNQIPRFLPIAENRARVGNRHI
jgi:hypothetical protein